MNFTNNCCFTPLIKISFLSYILISRTGSLENRSKYSFLYCYNEGVIVPACRLVLACLVINKPSLETDKMLALVVDDICSFV